MARYDWEALEPTLPLPGGDDRYVARPWGGGDRLAALVRHGLTPIGVTGPVGSGKTTELEQAVGVLADDDEVVAMPVPVELLVDVDDLQTDVLLYELSQYMLDHALEHQPGAAPSRGLVDDIRASDPRLPSGGGLFHKPPELARRVIAEVEKLLEVDRVALFLDGLDLVPPERGTAAVRALLAIQHHADLVVVVPPALANGPDSHDVLAHLRVFWIPTVPVHEADGRTYLEKVALRRLGRTRRLKSLHPIFMRAAEASGGITRLFLHLVQDAAFYASSRGLVKPNDEALDEAIRDRTDAFRRLVVGGDLEILAQADGTDGLDVPAERKVRLLSQNLLLEYGSGADRFVRPHPLVRRLIDRREGA